MKRPKSSYQRDKKLYLDYGSYNDINMKIIPTRSYTGIQKYNSIINNFPRNNKTYFINDRNLIDEQIYLLTNLWDNLGISQEHRNIFFNQIRNISNPNKMDFILKEKNILKELEELLLNLRKEVISRENNLELLKKYNESLVNIYNRDELINNILEEIINIIKKLRKDAINIIGYTIKLKKIINKGLNRGDIDIDIIKKNYLYEPKYLNKMKMDLFFLKDSAISNYIEMNNDKIDPFLLNCAPNRYKVDNFNRKITIPIEDEYIRIIKELNNSLVYIEDLNNNNNNSTKTYTYRINNYFEDKNRKYFNNNNKPLYNSIKKIKKKELHVGDLNINRKTYELKISHGNKYYDIFSKKIKNIKSNNNNYQTRINHNNNNSSIKINPRLLLNKNKIKIEREEIKPLTNNEFLHNLNELKTEYDYKTNNKRGNINNKINEKKYKNINLLSEDKKQTKISLNKNSNNIEITQKEMSENGVKENEEKNVYQLLEVIKILEKKLKNEENLRKKRENEIEQMKIMIKNGKEKKENDNNNQKYPEIYEEKIRLFMEENNQMKEEIKRDKNIIKEINEEKIKLVNEKIILKKENDRLKDDQKNLENNYNNCEKEKSNIESKYFTLNEENKALKERISQLEKQLINQNPNSIKLDYKIDYYRGEISDLLNIITNQISLKNIPDFLIRGLILNDSIFTEEYYLKGIFPKIIISTEGNNENNIKGLCSLYYESNENLSENLILRINSIFAVEDWENQIIKMIDFIKNNIKFKRLEIYILYDKIENKFVQNEESKKLFQKILGFKWLCVVRDEKHQQRYIRLFLQKDEEIQENQNLYQNNNFYLDNLSILTINNEENYNLLKDIINEEEQNELIISHNNKYINPYPIYSLIYENSLINKNYNDLWKPNELKELKEKLWRFIEIENGWNVKEEEKKKIKNICFNIEDSIYKKIENYYNSKNIECICDLSQTNISINFENNYSILINNIYYNKISSDKIKILKENKTESLFFLIPSNDNTVLFYISEVNTKLKELLLDNNENIYEKFLEFQPSSQKEIYEFSLISSRDISYIPPELKSSQKNIFIPSFSFDNHLFSYNLDNVEKNLNMMEKDTNKNLKITSVDEYMNVKFMPDENIENGFNLIPDKDKKNSYVIKNSFILGIFDNDIIDNNKLPLMKFLYITEKDFLTKNNYEPKLKSFI